MQAIFSFANVWFSDEEIINFLIKFLSNCIYGAADFNNYLGGLAKATTLVSDITVSDATVSDTIVSDTTHTQTFYTWENY